MDEVYKRFIASIATDTVLKFQKKIMKLWDEWEKTHKMEGISHFFHENGNELFSAWLAEIFPFDRSSVIIECPKGHSSVDSQLVASYTYDKNEIAYVNFVLNKLSINSYTAHEAARDLFANSIKSISPYLANLIGTKFKIFTSDINYYEIDIDGSAYVEFSGAGRIQ